MRTSKMTTAVVFNFVWFFENICTICLENFHIEYGKCVATCTVPLFAETFNKAVILVELFLELRIVVIQDSEDGKNAQKMR